MGFYVAVNYLTGAATSQSSAVRRKVKECGHRTCVRGEY